MKEAEKQLLQTLNGQLRDLPSVAKTMVDQYQLSAIAMAIVFGVLFIVVTVGTIWLSVFFYKQHKSWRDNYAFVTSMIAGIGTTIDVFVFTVLCLNIVHACAPIASLVSSILSN